MVPHLMILLLALSSYYANNTIMMDASLATRQDLLYMVLPKEKGWTILKLFLPQLKYLHYMFY